MIERIPGENERAFRLILSGLYEVQPGDGTRYTVSVHAMQPNGDIYVSAGAGDAIQGGYWLNVANLCAAVRSACAGIAFDDAERTRPILDYAEYWREHTPGVTNVCTARVALWAAYVAIYGNDDDDRWALMTAYSHGLYYRSNRERFIALIRQTHLRYIMDEVGMYDR
jgi:hypothetical protein